MPQDIHSLGGLLRAWRERPHGDGAAVPDGSTARIATPHGGPEAFERALVADLRRSAARLGNDPGFRSLITTVRARSPRFAELWDEGRAAAHQTLVKTIHHPVVGDVTLDCDVVTVPDSDVKLVVHTTAAGGPDAEKLDFLRVGAVCAAIPAEG